MKWAIFTSAPWPCLCGTCQVWQALLPPIKWAPNPGRYWAQDEVGTTHEHTSLNSWRSQMQRRQKPISYCYSLQSPNINILVAEKHYQLSRWPYPDLNKRKIIKHSLQTFYFFLDWPSCINYLWSSELNYIISLQNYIFLPFKHIRLSSLKRQKCITISTSKHQPQWRWLLIMLSGGK